MKSAATIHAEAEEKQRDLAFEQACADDKPKEIRDVFKAVADMAKAKRQICQAADELAEATERHNQALRALKAAGLE